MIKSQNPSTLFSRQKGLFVGGLFFVVFSLGLVQWRLNTGLPKWWPQNASSTFNSKGLPENNGTSYDKGTAGQSRELFDPFSYQTTPGMFLVFKCSGSDICGGFADRQRGLVSTFLLAVVTRRRFLVLFDTPCPLSNFYLPSRYDWAIKPDLLVNRTTRTIAAIDGGNRGFFNQLQSGNFNQLYPEDAVYLQTNNQLQKFIVENPLFQPLLPPWAKSEWQVFFKNAWNILMQPSDTIRKRLEVFLESVDFSHRTNPLVCVHLRIGTSPTLRDVLVYNSVASLGPVWDLVTSYVQNGSQLFLATDNSDVRNISRTRYGAQHHDVAEVILNIDQERSSEKACQGFEDSVLDQLILTFGDVLITTRSGFSEIAALLRDSNHSLFKFRDNKLSVETLASVYVLLPV